MWFSLCDPMLSRFSRTPTCDRHTDTGPWLVPRMHSVGACDWAADSAASAHQPGIRPTKIVCKCGCIKVRPHDTQ